MVFSMFIFLHAALLPRSHLHFLNIRNLGIWNITGEDVESHRFMDRILSLHETVNTNLTSNNSHPSMRSNNTYLVPNLPHAPAVSRFVVKDVPSDKTAPVHLDRLPKVAVCFAGAWRDWERSWATSRPNLIESLDADVFAVSDASAGGINNRGVSDTAFTVEKMKYVFGKRLRAAEHLSLADLRNLENLTFPEIIRAQKAGMKMFPYFFKIWRCGQLIHQHVARTGVPYDVVVRLRPDMSILAKWQIASTNRSGVYRLTVGPSCAEFGQRDVVIGVFTYQCMNDQLIVGTYSSMTVMMDLARFVTPHSAFLSGSPEGDQSLIAYDGGEPVSNLLAWRTGTRVIRVGLSSTITRALKCTAPNCYPAATWYQPDKKLYNCQARLFTREEMPAGSHISPWTDCSDPRVPYTDLEMWNPSFEKKPFARPPCGHVNDLAVHNPLGMCRISDGTAMLHRVHVIRNYGVPLLFDPPIPPSGGILLRDGVPG